MFNSTSNKVTGYILGMCEKSMEHYTKVINSCENISQLSNVTNWIGENFENLERVAECLPRRRRKLCLAAIKACRDYILQINLSKGAELIQEQFAAIFSKRKPTGGTFDSIFEMIKKNSVPFGCGVILRGGFCKKEKPEKIRPDKIVCDDLDVDSPEDKKQEKEDPEKEDPGSPEEEDPEKNSADE